jgi:hypothetical protein
MSTNSGDREYILNYSERNETASFKGGLADARRIQNVLFGKPRAGEADYGLNIQSYIAEILDDTTIRELEAKALDQIKRYCPDISIKAFIIEIQSAKNDPTGRGANNITIGITLGKSAASGEESFAIVGSVSNKKTTISVLNL